MSESKDGRARLLPSRGLVHENSKPVGLAAALGQSIFLGILLWPYGVLVVAYVVVRLHLNKIAALVGIVMSMPPAVAMFSRVMGHWVVRDTARPRLEWFVGSHIVAFSMAAVSTWVVYGLARRFQRPSTGIEV